MYAEDSDWERALWHYFYESDGKIDNVYIGSSHVYSDINPLLLDEINGQYNFNLSSSAQRLNGSYYLLKEADKNNSLSHVYLDLYYTGSAKTDDSPDLDPISISSQWNWHNTDYMRLSLNKLEYMLSIGGPEKYIDIIFPFSRYRSNLDNWDYIEEMMEKKNSNEYFAYELYEDTTDRTYIEYLKQGCYYSVDEIADTKKLIAKDIPMDENPMGETSEKYLHKIISYCQRRDIPITLLVTPIETFQLINLENYDNFVNQVKSIAEEYGVDFYDFNLAKEEYLSIQHTEYFRDDKHLNTAGAEVFTDFFAKVVSGTASENEKYFYSSFAGKLENEPPSVYGLYYESAKSNGVDINEANSMEDIYIMYISSNREKGMEYRIIITPEDGEQYMVQDFAENKEFTIPKGTHGICTIVARMENDPEQVQTFDIRY